MYELVLERSSCYGQTRRFPFSYQLAYVGLCLTSFNLVECSVRRVWPCVRLWDLLSSEVATKPGPLCVGKMANQSQ